MNSDAKISRRRPVPLGCLTGVFLWFFDVTRFWIYIVLFFALMAVCSYAVVSHYVKGRELQAPILTGMTLDEALAKVGDKTWGSYRLSVAWGGTRAHETARKGIIISQQP